MFGTDSNFITSLIKVHAKPVLKEVFLEFLSDNHLTVVSTTAADSTKLLSTNEVAEIMGVNRHRIYKLINEGLPYMDKKPFKFRREDVNEFISKNIRQKKKTSA